MDKIIASCGNNCSACPRYINHPYEKTEEELHHTAELWMKIGYRVHVVTCCQELHIATCAECKAYPCEKMLECFSITKSFEPICKKVCTSEEYERIKKAFMVR